MASLRRGLIADMLIAIALAASASAVRLFLDPFFGDYEPYLALYPAVAIAGWVVGARGAILTATIGFLTADYFFVSPREALNFPNSSNVAIAVTFVIGSAVIIWLTYRGKKLVAEANVARSDVQKANEAFREADRKKDEFLSLLSHELRTPLAAVVLSSHVLKGRVGRDPVSQSAIDIQDSQLRQLGVLLDDLLDIARITRGRIELHRERLDVRRSVQDAIEANASQIESKAQKLHIAMPEKDSLLALIDPARVTQIVSNLLNNASKYSPTGSRIWIRAQQVTDQIAVTVQDEGRGIAPEMLSAIFTAFHSGPVEHVAEHGLGLGLWLSHRLADLHGGILKAYSEGLGLGARFELRLPLISEQLTQERSAVLMEGRRRQ